MFENAEITVAELPAVADLEWRRLGVRYARKLQVQTLLAAGVAAAVALLTLALPLDVAIPYGLVWTMIAAWTVWGLAWPLVSVPRMGWAMRQLDLVYRSGVLWRSEAAVPFNRVQHAETASTPLDRAFGLATLHLYTAGGSASDLQIHGLPADVAGKLRLFVLERAGADVEG